MLNYKILIWLPQICPLWCCVSEQRISCDGFTRSFQLFLSQGACKYLCYTSRRKLMIFLRRDHQSNWTCVRYALFSAFLYDNVDGNGGHIHKYRNQRSSEKFQWTNQKVRKTTTSERTKVYSNNGKTFSPAPQCIENEIKISRCSNVSPASRPVI